MKKNFKLAKVDIDKYTKQSPVILKKNREKDSLTAKKLQIKELFMESQDKQVQQHETNEIINKDTNDD